MQLSQVLKNLFENFRKVFPNPLRKNPGYAYDTGPFYLVYQIRALVTVILHVTRRLRVSLPEPNNYGMI